MKHANILSTVGRTPILKLNRLAPDGVDVWVKMEAFNPLGSVKDRLALGVIEAAERDGRPEGHRHGGESARTGRKKRLVLDPAVRERGEP